MRTFEVLLLVVLAMTLAALLVQRRSRWLTVAGLIALLIQVTLEAFRWQVLPAYVLAVLILPIASVPARKRVRSRFSALTMLGNLTLLVLLVVAVALPLLLPVFVLPEPTGPHAIGTTYLHLVDESRDEQFTPEVGEPRELHLQVWYPAQPRAGSIAEPYTRHAQTWSRTWVEGSRVRRLPFLWNHLELVETHSYPDAPPAPLAAPCPLLVFSHGTWQSWKRNTSLLEELASHGYVVVALSHPYLTPFTLDAAGDAVTFQRSHPRLRALAQENRRVDFDPVMSALRQELDADDLMPVLREYYRQCPIQQQVDQTWARDITFVLDELTQFQEHVFSELVDLDRIGVLGFSRGGRAAGLAAMQDARIKAGVNIDGWQTGHLLGMDLNEPFLFVTGGSLQRANDYFFQRSNAPVYELTLLGARHANFHDMALTAPILGRLSGKLGEFDPAYGLELVRERIRGFLDEHLRDRPSTLLREGPGACPQINLRTRRP
jgi:predicted dienelactone hydrolase